MTIRQIICIQRQKKRIQKHKNLWKELQKENGKTGCCSNFGNQYISLLAVLNYHFEFKFDVKYVYICIYLHLSSYFLSKAL